MDDNFKSITLETHFGIEGNDIKAFTRNKCSEDLIGIIEEIAKILYPDQDIEIYFSPSEPGSFKEIIKFIGKNKVVVTAGTLIAIGNLAIATLNYKDDHKSHQLENDNAIIETVEKCIELRKSVESLNPEYEVVGIPEDKLKIICGNVSLIKKKNDLYDTLIKDDAVNSNEFTLKDAEDNPIKSQKISREEFPNYIEAYPDQHYSAQNISAIVELISPVFKQKKEGKGITWRGTYFGESIVYDDVLIIGKEEDVDFYMQDADFKKRILDKEQSFKIGDTMKIVFDVTGELKEGVISNRSIYVKEVESINETTIQHTEKPQKSTNVISENQEKLF